MNTTKVGSHIQLKHADGRRVTGPFHRRKDIKRGALGGIIEDLGISEEEFLRIKNKKK
jgi:predicted RNA binding protein YcfA (HicA-like mRNA interferase family)